MKDLVFNFMLIQLQHGVAKVLPSTETKLTIVLLLNQDCSLNVIIVRAAYQYHENISPILFMNHIISNKWPQRV